MDDNKNRNSSSSSSSSRSSSSSSSNNNNVYNINRICGIGDGDTVDNLSIQQCEEFERQLTDRLLNITNRKVYIISSCLIYYF